MKPEKKIIKVNGKKYEIHASYASSQKTKYQALGLSVTLRIIVTNLTDNKIMEWKEIKDSYLQEKVEDWIKTVLMDKEVAIGIIQRRKKMSREIKFRMTINNLNNRLSEYFNKYAKTFIGWDCKLTVQRKTIKEMPHYYYLPLVDNSLRENPDAVSESQRFFLDQAFRMAIINFIQDNVPNFSTFFITETPEGSLDLIYEAQVAEMFLKFAKTNNNIIFTSNLNSSYFLKKLFDNFSEEESDKKILNLLEKAKMSDLQKKERVTLDLMIKELRGGKL